MTEEYMTDVLSISVECEPATARVAKPYPFIEIAEGSIYERDKKLYAGNFVRGGYDPDRRKM